MPRDEVVCVVCKFGRKTGKLITLALQSVEALLSKEVNTPFVFAILPVSNAKSIRDERYDLVCIHLWTKCVPVLLIYICREHLQNFRTLPSFRLHSQRTLNRKSWRKLSWPARLAKLYVHAMNSNHWLSAASLRWNLKSKPRLTQTYNCFSLIDKTIRSYGGDKDIFVQLTFDLSAGKQMIELACEIPDIIAGLQFSQDVSCYFPLWLQLVAQTFH